MLFLPLPTRATKLCEQGLQLGRNGIGEQAVSVLSHDGLVSPEIALGAAEDNRHKGGIALAFIGKAVAKRNAPKMRWFSCCYLLVLLISDFVSRAPRHRGIFSGEKPSCHMPRV